MTNGRWYFWGFFMGFLLLLSFFFFFKVKHITYNQLVEINSLKDEYTSRLAYKNQLEYEINNIIIAKIKDIDNNFQVPTKDQIKFVSIKNDDNNQKKPNYIKIITNLIKDIFSKEDKKIEKNQ